MRVSKTSTKTEKHDEAVGRRGPGRGIQLRRRPRVTGAELPPPDPATRVDLEGPTRTDTRARGTGSKPGQMTVVLGLVGLLGAAMSKFADLIHLPSSSEISVAGFAIVLLGLGAVQLTRPQPVEAPADTRRNDQPAPPPDLPSLTGQLATLLSELRQGYGLAYRTSTWLEEVLPSMGFTGANTEITRDVLAVAALDAGGLRADITALVSTHGVEAATAAATELLLAIDRLRDACQQRELSIGELPPSDPPSWAAALAC